MFSCSRRILRRVLPLAAAIAAAPAALAQPPLPPVPPVPPENPITEPKRLLGKAIFWDEQLSFDNTNACATCHSMARAGSDDRRARHPGADTVFNTPDDVFGSPGVIHSDALTDYVRDTFFSLAPQVTPRAANTMINAAFAPELFWDGRASATFTDPETGQARILNRGALESQVVAPPLSTVEKAHDGLDWPAITAKLAAAGPLALARDLPPDLAAAIPAGTTYPQLFANAFGDGAITATRIAFAIATYERTLIANDTPWDRTQRGDAGGMTPQQQQGFGAFLASNCNACHGGNQFTGNGFRNIGLRPSAEDLGRQIVTSLPGDRGRFKVPGLRNVGLKTTFMHNGQFTSLTDVIRFYARAPGAAPQFPADRDPVMLTVNVPPPAAVVIEEFLRNGLTDARVASAAFPFDHPTLYSLRPAAELPSSLINTGTPGTAGLIPQIVAHDPPMVGSTTFRLGLGSALPGAAARIALSSTPPVNGRLTPERFLDPVTITADGVATAHWTLSPRQVAGGQVLYAQWIVTDSAATNSEALSTVARLPFFCPRAGCPAICTPDLNDDGAVTIQDLFDFLSFYFASDPRADLTGNGHSVQDIFDFLAAYFTGCL